MTSVPIRVLPVPGTWARRKRHEVQWFNDASPLASWLAARGITWLRGRRGEAFEWTTDLNGWQAWRRWWPFNKWTRPSFGDWEVGGTNLFQYLCSPFAEESGWYPAAETHLIGHSHALPVILFACASGLKVNTLITICSPVRSDPEMVEAFAAARRNIGHWIHFYSDGDDRVQIAGDLGDGRVRIAREHPLADRNIYVPGGHSGVLNDPTLFQFLVPALEEVRRRHGRA